MRSATPEAQVRGLLGRASAFMRGGREMRSGSFQGSWMRWEEGGGLMGEHGVGAF